MLYLELLKENIQLYYDNELTVKDVIIINKTKYEINIETKEAEGFVGFFDWTKKKENLINGVRLLFFPHQNFLKKISNLPYINNRGKELGLEIKFINEPNEDSLSNEQDFGSNFFYSSHNETYILTFNIEMLSDIEKEYLIKRCDLIKL